MLIRLGTHPRCHTRHATATKRTEATHPPVRKTPSWCTYTITTFLQAPAVTPLAHTLERRPLYVGGLACTLPLTSMCGTPKMPPHGRSGNFFVKAPAAAVWSCVPSSPVAQAEILLKSSFPLEAHVFACDSQSSPLWSSQHPMKSICRETLSTTDELPAVTVAALNAHSAHLVPGHPAASSGHSKPPSHLRMAAWKSNSTAAAIPSAVYSFVNVGPNCLQKGQFAPKV